ncbi:hypothetical protein CPB97_010264 [Podila verticillata]|nr:hypothetical protein CPB97_010264 [Podila verticillata]
MGLEPSGRSGRSKRVRREKKKALGKENNDPEQVTMENGQGSHAKSPYTKSRDGNDNDTQDAEAHQSGGSPEASDADRVLDGQESQAVESNISRAPMDGAWEASDAVQVSEGDNTGPDAGDDDLLSQKSTASECERSRSLSRGIYYLTGDGSTDCSKALWTPWLVNGQDLAPTLWKYRQGVIDAAQRVAPLTSSVERLKKGLDENSLGRRPDFMLRTTLRGIICYLFFMEAKKVRQGAAVVQDDLEKMAGMMKDAVDDMSKQGIDVGKVEVICFHIVAALQNITPGLTRSSGTEGRLYAMKLEARGIYVLRSIAVVYAPRSHFDFGTTSQTFSVEIDPTKTVDGLKKLIKAEKTNDFSDVDADKLTIWRVSIPITDDDDEIPILLNNVINNKKKLGPATRISNAFPEELPEETVHIIVQRPPPVHAHVPARISTPLSGHLSDEST